MSRVLPSVVNCVCLNFGSFVYISAAGKQMNCCDGVMAVLYWANMIDIRKYFNYLHMFLVCAVAIRGPFRMDNTHAPVFILTNECSTYMRLSRERCDFSLSLSQTASDEVQCCVDLGLFKQIFFGTFHDAFEYRQFLEKRLKSTSWQLISGV